MSEDERAHARTAWEALVKQRRAYGECSAYLYDHRDDPDWETLDRQLQAMDARLGELQWGLWEWTQAPYEPFLELLCEVCP